MELPRNMFRFIQFLKQDLAVSDREISVVLRDPDLSNGSFSMLLWKYGLITIEQLEQIFDWFDAQGAICPVLQYVDVKSAGYD
ncbi:MAG: DUF2949 domain-containing protein [Elainellaceae cyanobacterium]